MRYYVHQMDADMSETAHHEQESDARALHRCFFALRFDDEVNAQLAALTDELRAFGADISWVRTQNLHVTMRFLGEITDEQLERVLAIPGDGLVDAFSLRAQGLGAFPGLRVPKIMWAGVAGAAAEDGDRFLELQALTEQWARAVGLPHEHRRFRPHVTIGRMRRPGDNLREVVDVLTTRELITPPSRIDAVRLLRSTPSGIYEEIGRWGLRAG